jgi:PAS domain S-box-containing protein
MRACGLPLEEITGRTDLEIWAPDLARTCRENDARALTSGELTIVEEELELYDGSRVWIETIRVPVFGDREEAVGTAGIARNITARRQAEAALREREEHYRQLFVQSQDALILFRQGSGEIIEVNSRACELYGRIREEFVDGGLSLILPPRVGAAHGELSSFIRNGATFLRDKVRSVRRDGTELYVSVRGKGIRIGGEAVVCCSFREVPEELRPSP